MTAVFAGIVPLVLIYLLRFFTSINSYLFLVITGITFMFYSVSVCHLISENNYLVEHTALQCGEDADHARNLS